MNNIHKLRFWNNLLVGITFILLSCNSKEVKTDLDYSNYKTSRDLVTDTYVLLHINGDTIIHSGKYKHLNSIDDHGMILARKDNKNGYIDIFENVLIPFEFEDLGVFSEEVQLAPAKKEGKYGYIKRSGEAAIPFVYEKKSYFYISGLASNKINDKYGFIDSTGHPVIPFIYDDAIITPHDTIVAAKKNTKWAFFSNKGEELTDFIFDEVELTEDKFDFFSNGPVLVRRGKQVAFYDQNMNEIIPFGVYRDAQTFNCLGTTIVKKNGRYGMIDSIGQIIIPVEYNEIELLSLYSDFSELILLRKGKSIQILNKELTPITSHKIKDYEYKGLLIVKDDKNKYALFNKKGKALIPFIYDELTLINNSNLIAKSANKYGIISNRNDTLTDFIFDRMEKLWHGENIIATKKNRSGVINDKGEEILPFEYQAIYHATDNTFSNFIVQRNNKIGKVDRNNQEIIPIVYDGLSGWVEYSPDAHFVKKDNKYGLISYEGETILPIIYDYVGLAEPETNEIIVARKSGKYGVVSWENTEILPFIYDKIITDIDYWSPEDSENKIIAFHNGIWQSFDLKGNIISNNIVASEIEKKYIYYLDQDFITNDKAYDMKVAKKIPDE